MVLVLDPLVREKVSGLQNMCPSEDSTSDPEVISTFQRQRCDSSQSDHQGAPSERPSCNSSTSSTDSQVDAGQGDHAHDECDWAALGFLPNGSRRGEKSSAEQKVCQGQETPAKQRLHKHTDLSSGGVLGRVFSVRDRMLKFSEPASCGAPPLRRGSQRSSRFTGPSPTATDTQSQEGPVVGVPLQAPPPSSSSSAVPPSPRPQTLTGESEQGEAAPARRGDRVGCPLDISEQGRTTEQTEDMKTFLTIEIKDGRTTFSQPTSGPQRPSPAGVTSILPNSAPAASQRAELTLGLRASPFKISTSTFSTGPPIKMDPEPVLHTETATEIPAVHNGSSAPRERSLKVTSEHSTSAVARAEGHSGTLSTKQLDAIEDEEILDKMLDSCRDFDERKLIRAAMRELRKKKREAAIGCTQEEMDLREKERDQRLEELRRNRDDRAQKPRVGEVVVKQVEKSADGSTVSQTTKTNRFTQSDDGRRATHSTITESRYVQKTDKGTVQTKSYSYSTSSSSSAKKVGSVFDREDDPAAERRQAERRKELMRAQTTPKTSAVQARQAMMEKLDGGSSGNVAVARVNKVQRSTSFGVPNANSIKQMLLDWCRAKTRSYENVDIQNFSSSWSDGLAFCALVHNFFPDAFDYSKLNSSNRRQNFEVAFSTAETLVDCPQLLDVEDMVRLREPDWKCVYTYLQEFYRGLVQKGLVKTKGSA